MLLEKGKMWKSILALAGVSAMAAGFFTGCSPTGNTTSAVSITANFSSIYSVVISQNCMGCHQPGGSASNNGVQLDFTSAATAYTTLTTTNVSGISSTGTCGGIAEVQSGNASHSYLAGVLLPDYHIANFAGVGGCTPYANHINDQSISPDEESAIVTWINAGAANN